MANTETSDSNVTEFPTASQEADEALTSNETQPAPIATISGSQPITTEQPLSAYERGLRDGHWRALDRTKEIDRQAEQARKTGSLLIVLGFVVTLLSFVGFQNINIFVLDKDTVSLLSRGMNAVVLLTLPFILGMLGAVSRLLLSGVNIPTQYPLVIGSGIMSAFSWIGIKSGVLVAIIAPHITKAGFPETVEITRTSNDFYTLALVAILVGMFSTNLYIFINEKVEKLASERKAKDGV